MIIEFPAWIVFSKEHLKFPIKTSPAWFLDLFKAYMVEGIALEEQKLVLPQKPNKQLISSFVLPDLPCGQGRKGGRNDHLQFPFLEYKENLLLRSLVFLKFIQRSKPKTLFRNWFGTQCPPINAVP